MSGFTVNSTALMAGGQAISAHGSAAQALQPQANAAEVPPKAWGLLGLSLGLFPMYVALLDDLGNHLQQMGVHLDNTGGALTAMHQAYTDLEQNIVGSFKDIGSGMASGAAIAGPAGAVVGGLVGPSPSVDMTKVPLAGNAYKTFTSRYSAANAIGKGDVAEASQAVAETGSAATGFAADALAIGTDPLNFLISKGLGFLESFLTPLKDALQLVTGDPAALKESAARFDGLAKSIKEVADQVEHTATSCTADWTGHAAPAAGQAIGETKQSIDTTAEAAGHIATLLKISSMLMQAAYDIINGIIADVIEYIVVTWIAAQAAAAGATAVEVGVGAEQAGTKAQEAASILQKIMSVIKKISDLLKKLKNTAFGKFVQNEEKSTATTSAKEAGAGAKNLAGKLDQNGKVVQMETFKDASAKVAARTGTEATTNQAAGQMIRDNIGTVVGTSAKNQALSAVGLRRPADGANLAETIHQYAEDVSKGTGIVGGAIQAGRYSADPGASSEGQPPATGGSEGA
jgi:uncharacterized protein YukE